MFSFRVDRIGDDLLMNTLFDNFKSTFKPAVLFICFENKTKAGIDCKDHFHGLAVIDTKIKIESQRDKIKKFFSKQGADKSLSHVQIVETDKKSIHNAYCYTAKQQKPFYTNLHDEQIKKILEDSKINQEKIKPLSNTWKEHEPLIFQQCQAHYKNTKSLSRHEMLRIIFNYLYDWNHSHPDDLAIKRYANSTIMTFMYNTEIKLLPKIQSLQLFMEDFKNFSTTCYEPIPELRYDSDGDFNFIDSDDV